MTKQTKEEFKKLYKKHLAVEHRKDSKVNLIFAIPMFFGKKKK